MMARPKKVETQPEPVILGEFEAMQSAQCSVAKVDQAVADVGVQMGVYRLSQTAQIPRYATEGSACFDLRADFTGIDSIRAYTAKNEEVTRRVDQDNKICMFDPGDRAMIPTNLIFDIPNGYKILVYPRSGNSLKRSISLANCVGVIDSDYVDPCYILVKFNDRIGGHVVHGEAIAQAELVPVTQAQLTESKIRPAKKTSRTGGFGSTGS